MFATLRPLRLAPLLLLALVPAQGQPAALEWPPRPAAPRVRYAGSIQRLEDGGASRSLWKRITRALLGREPSYTMVRPFGIATDAQGRILVVDNVQRLVHVLDYGRHRYWHLAGSSRERFVSPVAVTTDEAGNIYVTDSFLGKIFAFRPDGRFWRFLGEAGGGEGIFKRPTGLAFDSIRHVFYLTDTLYHKIFVLDRDGIVVRVLGQRGSEPGEFNFPLALALHQDRLYVVDAMNFRVQILDLEGRPLGGFGSVGDGSGTFSKPKSVALDSEGHIYVVDSLFEVVQVFDSQGRFLLAFGGAGSEPGKFQLPTGIFIDPADRIYVADSYNSRVQVFQYLKAGESRRLGPP